MPHGTIAVLATDSTLDHGAILTALCVSDTQDTHLDIHCIGLESPVPDAFAMESAAPLSWPHDGAALARAEALEADLRPIVPKHRCNVAFCRQTLRVRSVGSELPPVIRFADWIVAAAPHDTQDRSSQVAVLEAALFVGGLPVIVVPKEGIEIARAPTRIAVAWDGSREALAAVRSTLPILRRAQLVDVVVVDPDIRHGDRSDPGGNLALFLARNGVHVEINVLSRSRPRICDILCRHGFETGAEAMVMGAFGHSRLRETLFGSTTRDMLRASRIPLILAR
ncbi:universal stress protein [Limimaricola litoreus]|uniref:Universal stress protein n=1 Tax=Limimaricola litoreus TaxID=2955316 RepID=A0A9X2FQ47_9RHOB|nr:universal stress protein [Limimaricola litoreus]MCP1167754.1 universal stress protein [Limimaricola litoreus]